MRHHRTTHHRKILAVLLLVALASAYALAGMQHSHSSKHEFSWKDDNRSLSMHSSDATGLVVDSVSPNQFDGLQAGDVILAIDHRHIGNVDDLFKALQDRGKAPATLRVRRAGVEIAVTWTHTQYQELLPPPPPPPPNY